MGFGEIFDRVLDRVPARLAAGIDLRRPGLWDSWGGPLNGQRGRQALVHDLVDLCRFTRIVETGTFRGVTTQFLADLSGLPVFSCELIRRYFLFSCARLSRRDVHLVQSDSRSFLSNLARDPHTSSGATLFYLDAHWEDDLPLAEELQIIAPQWPTSIVIVDDFRVPSDPAYAYDNYGPGRALEEAILPAEQLGGWALAYPSLHAARETGARRGCCILIGPPLIETAGRSAHLSIERTL